MTILRNLQGLQFGRFTVEGRAENTPSGKARWTCRCQCGVLKIVTSGALVTGHISSCGCLKKEMLSVATLTHGGSRTPEYEVWQAMWARCTNPKNRAYLHYKDRCPPPAWRSFEVFYEELGPRPSSLHSLDRRDNNLPYGPGNCRWATAVEQSNNRGTFILRVSLDGDEMSFTAACRKVGIKAAPAFERWYRTKDMHKASLGRFKLVEAS
jgi:hypothetical protein